MMTGSDSTAVAGGLARHIPVLVRRAVGWLGVRNGGLYVDATFGAGGFTRAILATPGARVIGIDRDHGAIEQGAGLVAQAQGRLELIEDRFSNLQSIVGSHGAAAVDGVVFDLGVSSMQLDEAARGFSFRLDGPLDMRMGRDGPSAADIVARAGLTAKVTVSTNMAGRGTDIKLGEGVKELGGLHVVCTEMHDSARIDWQLRGRCGRQGDPGSWRQYLALDDELLETGLGPKKARRYEALGESSGGSYNHLNGLFRRAQRKVEKRHFRDRRALMYFEKQRKKMQQQMGQDVYLDTPG